MDNPLLQENGLPHFSEIRPEHVEPALTETLERNRRELDAILSGTAERTFAASILPMEQMRERLHRTWAPVSHLHGVQNSDELREVYNRCLPQLARYETELAQDRRLFDLYKTVAENLPDDASSAERSLLEHALRDFHLAGVDLPDDKKARFREVMEELSQLQARFDQNLLDAMAAWSHHETAASRLAGIPDSTLKAAATAARDAALEGWLLHLDQPTYLAVLTHADDERLRREFFIAWVTRASDQGPNAGEFDNSALMDRILRLREKAATLAGYANFADYALATRMADNIGEVREFLMRLVTVAKPVGAGELQTLEDFAGRKLEAWDIAYFAEKLRRKQFSISDEDLRPYFPLDRVLTGLLGVMTRLYGIRAEAYDVTSTWDPQVRYYRLLDDSANEIGGFFMDLFARRAKRSGAWMDECLIRTDVGRGLQKPVAHLVCNFALPSDGEPCLLSHDEVVTLFHEFGHTLHHLLTKVDLPSVSGINGVPWDAVELPSQFMENFAWSPEVIRTMSGHFETGEHLPEELIHQLEASRVFQAGLQMLRQLEFALFDLRIHSELTDADTGKIMQVLREVREQVAVVRQPELNRMAHGFSHVFSGGYAAGYYSYKWAEVLAADAFAAFEEEGLFDADTAARFRSRILQVGGATDIGEAFREFRGRPPQIEPLLIQAGILPGDAPLPQ